MSEPGRLTVLHLAPHPDDEAIGAGATLLALRDSGHEVINLACSLGRASQHDRRRLEAEEASSRAGFELLVHDPPLAISADDDLDAAQRVLTATVIELVAARGVSIVVSPSPHDGHHGHEVVGRSARDSLRESGALRPHWWMWGLWDDLPFPTLVTPFEAERLDSVLHVLSAHEGEVGRNDYGALVRGRAAVSRVLGAEKVFGYGERGLAATYADLLTEAIEHDGRWYTGTPRTLDPSDPLAGANCELPLDWWLDAPSAAQRMRDVS